MRFALAMICAMTLSACAKWTGGSAATAEAACAVWPYTPYSAKDTRETIDGNRLNNARRDGWCGRR